MIAVACPAFSSRVGSPLIRPRRFARLKAGETVTPDRETGLPRYTAGNLAVARGLPNRRRLATTNPSGILLKSCGSGDRPLPPDADIRHRCGRRTARGTGRVVGPYLAHAESKTTDGRSVHTLFGLTYSDIHPNAGPNGAPAGQPQNVVRFRSAAISLRPSRDPGLHQRVIPPPLPFAQSANLTGDWRTFRIDVTPDGIRVEWKDQDGTFVPVSTMAGDPTRLAYDGLQTVMNKDEPGSGVIVPDWSPRMPLGVWSFRAGVSLRNVTISPL